MNPTQAIRELTSSGWTEAQLAAAVGVSQPTINRLKHSRRTTSYDIGAALVALVGTPPPKQQEAA